MSVVSTLDRVTLTISAEFLLSTVGLIGTVDLFTCMIKAVEFGAAVLMSLAFDIDANIAILAVFWFLT